MAGGMPTMPWIIHGTGMCLHKALGLAITADYVTNKNPRKVGRRGTLDWVCGGHRSTSDFLPYCSDVELTAMTFTLL